MIRQISIVTGLLLCLSAMPVACSSNSEPTSGSGEFEKTVPPTTVPVGVDYEVRGTSPNKKVDITNLTDRHIRGCIVFTDADGEVVSRLAATIPAGAIMTVPIPPGATGQHVTDEGDCGNDAPTSSTPALLALATRRTEHFHQGMVLIPRLNRQPNMEHYITGRAIVGGDFFQSARDLAQGGYRSDFALLPGVTHVDALLFEVVVDAVHPMELTLASNETFDAIEVWVNGVLVQDKAAAQVPSVLGIGWDAWTFSLPATLPEWNYDPTPGALWENQVEVRFTRPNDPWVYNLHRNLGYTSE